MKNFFANLAGHLNIIPGIVAAIQAFQAIGHSKESAVQKVGDVVKVSAAIGEEIPVPIVAGISTLVEDIAQQIFKTPAAPSTPTTQQPGIANEP